MTPTPFPIEHPAEQRTAPTVGDWWPRTRKLDVAVPALLAAVARRHGPVVRVLFHDAEWEDRPNRIAFRNHIVKLDHNQIQSPGTVTVIGLDQQRIHVRVRAA